MKLDGFFAIPAPSCVHSPLPQTSRKQQPAERGDYATAFQEFRYLAEQGLAIAQSNLGAMYYKGLGVLQDYVQAHMRFNLAASQGNAGAAGNRDIVAKRITSQQVSEAQAFARKWASKNRQ